MWWLFYDQCAEDNEQLEGERSFGRIWELLWRDLERRFLQYSLHRRVVSTKQCSEINYMTKYETSKPITR